MKFISLWIYKLLSGSSELFSYMVHLGIAEWWPLTLIRIGCSHSDGCFCTSHSLAHLAWHFRSEAYNSVGWYNWRQMSISKSWSHEHTFFFFFFFSKSLSQEEKIQDLPWSLVKWLLRKKMHFRRKKSEQKTYCNDIVKAAILKPGILSRSFSSMYFSTKQI